jgi:hypothetical protein
MRGKNITRTENDACAEKIYMRGEIFTSAEKNITRAEKDFTCGDKIPHARKKMSHVRIKYHMCG